MNLHVVSEKDRKAGLWQGYSGTTCVPDCTHLVIASCTSEEVSFSASPLACKLSTTTTTKVTILVERLPNYFVKGFTQLSCGTQLFFLRNFDFDFALAVFIIVCHQRPGDFPGEEGGGAQPMSPFCQGKGLKKPTT